MAHNHNHYIINIFSFIFQKHLSFTNVLLLFLLILILFQNWTDKVKYQGQWGRESLMVVFVSQHLKYEWYYINVPKEQTAEKEGAQWDQVSSFTKINWSRWNKGKVNFFLIKPKANCQSYCKHNLMICVPYICFLYFHSAAQIACWIVSGTLQMCRWLVFITGVGISSQIICLKRRQSHCHIIVCYIHIVQENSTPAKITHPKKRSQKKWKLLVRL